MYCTNCGAKLREGASFCTECGAKAAASPDPFDPQSTAPASVVTEPLPNAAQTMGRAPVNPAAPADPASEGAAKDAAKKNIAVPIAIVLGAVVVVLALVIVFFVVKPASSTVSNDVQQDAPIDVDAESHDDVDDDDDPEIPIDMTIKKIDTSDYPESVSVWLDIEMGESHIDLSDALDIEEEDVRGTDYQVTDYKIDLQTNGYHLLTFAPQGDCSAGTRSIEVSFTDQSGYDGDVEIDYQVNAPAKKDPRLKGTRWTHTKEFTFVLPDGTRDTQTIRVDDDNCVLADSSKRAYTQVEIDKLGLSDAEKCIAWNEMYARQHFDFHTCLGSWFDDTGWFKREKGNRDSLKGAVPNANYKLLRKKDNPYINLYGQD